MLAPTQGTLFDDQSFAFGPGFLRDHAGQLITEPRVAIIELVANAYDAGATLVDIEWPIDVSPRLSVTDNGTGLTRAEFERRWRTLSYDRLNEQGLFAEFPPGVSHGHRAAFGRSGKGRHAAFCFADEYHVETWKAGVATVARVGMVEGGIVPFSCVIEREEDRVGHGTKVWATAVRHLLPVDAARELIGSKFAVDPSFQVRLNGQAIVLRSLKNIKASELSVEPHGTVRMSEIDASVGDRTARLRGITWWVNERMVGEPSWEGLDGEGAYLDGRTAEAKRFSFVVQADMMKPDVKDDWTGFYACKRANEVRQAVHAFVVRRLSELLAGSKREQKKAALAQTQHVLRSLTPVSRNTVGTFIDQVLDRCPTISQKDLSRTAEVLAKLEQTRSGYEFLGQLAACSPEDIDTWNDLMKKWTATSAELVLNELFKRLKLVEKLQVLVKDSGTDELHDLQPLFERGLWVFGPEYEAVDFRSNRSLAEIIGNFLGGGSSSSPRRRPDFVVLPDRSVGVYSADEFDAQGEVAGLRKVLIVELKRGGFKLTQDEVDQARNYAKEITKAGRVQPSTLIEGYVLGALFEEALEPMMIGDRIRIQPMTFETLLSRAHARTFNLQRRLEQAQPAAPPDQEVEEVLAEGTQQVLFEQA